MVESVTMNSRGMITIPADIRKKRNFKEGSRFTIMELDGQLTIIPIQTAEELRTDLIPREVLEKSLEEDRKTELELEGRPL
ncbi:MAG: AbrB/MazE/SpoVT family DNA-binding domain-containing protein [Candidatus Lokiarchaeota archaeon]|nr:AbrB/MazE/SpoVT family DNA-binding domain-containing protein [Candidatus Lokiarchaeota archaeon]